MSLQPEERCSAERRVKAHLLRMFKSRSRCVFHTAATSEYKMKLLWGPVEAKVSPDPQQPDLSCLQEIKTTRNKQKPLNPVGENTLSAIRTDRSGICRHTWLSCTNLRVSSSLMPWKIQLNKRKHSEAQGMKWSQKCVSLGIFCLLSRWNFATMKNKTPPGDYFFWKRKAVISY